MDNDIESLDQRRMTYLKWYLIGITIGLVLMLTRHFFRIDGLNKEPIGIIVLVGIIFGLLVTVISVIFSAVLERDIHQDPRLDSALNNELVAKINSQSWIAAYIGTCLMTLFFAFTSSFYPICDPVSISLTSIVTGAVAHRAYFYFRYIMI